MACVNVMKEIAVGSHSIFSCVLHMSQLADMESTPTIFIVHDQDDAYE